MGGSFPPAHGFVRCDPRGSGIRHGDKRLGGASQGQTVPPLEDRGGTWGLILRAVWKAAGNFKQESDRIRSGFGNTSPASGIHTNCAVREDVSSWRSARLDYQTLPPGRVPTLPGHTAQDSRQSGPPHRPGVPT